MPFAFVLASSRTIASVLSESVSESESSALAPEALPVCLAPGRLIPDWEPMAPLRMWFGTSDELL